MSATSALEPALAQTPANDVATQPETVDVVQAESRPDEQNNETVGQAEKKGIEEKAEDQTPGTPTPALSQGEREKVAARIRQASGLPEAIKERLAALVAATGDAAANGQARVPIDEAIRAIEEALPDFLRMNRPQANPAEHPGGDAFFSGNPSELSDVDAEELARGQLARSGFLRGQRVRVAE